MLPRAPARSVGGRAAGCPCRQPLPRYNRHMDRLERIVVDPQVLMGQPVIRGTRLPVYAIVGALAAGDSKEDIREAFPYLTDADISEALLFASRMSHLTLEVA